MSPSRRTFLAGTAGLGALALTGLAGRLLHPPVPSARLAPVDDLAKALFDRLSARGQTDAFVPYDDPLRQYHNRGLATAGIDTLLLRRAEQALVVDLMHASLSAAGRTHLTEQFFLGLIGVNYGKILFCGTPHEKPYQLLYTGAHVNLRMGGANREGVAFGGPQIYGDQRGNEELGVPGNVYRDQLLAGQAMIASLSTAAQAEARRPVAPAQTLVEVQGKMGRFDGLPVADMPTRSREHVREMLELILGNYAEGDAQYAWQCIRDNGGIDAFHVADYDIDHQGGHSFAGAPSQIFRLESPAAVFHFRAVPHLHAFFNVAADGEAPLSVGEVVTTNDRVREKHDLRLLFEDVLRHETSLPLAYYPTRAVAGRLRAGTIRTGDVYNAESWDDSVAIVEINKSDLSPETRSDLERATSVSELADPIRIAMSAGTARFHNDYGIARTRIISTGASLREATIRRLRESSLA